MDSVSDFYYFEATVDESRFFLLLYTNRSGGCGFESRLG